MELAQVRLDVPVQTFIGRHTAHGENYHQTPPEEHLMCTGMEQAARVQPDALLSDIFFDSSAGSSSGRKFEEGSGYDHSSEPHGLQTVHR
jgi:hypothetical protein